MVYANSLANKLHEKIHNNKVLFNKV